MDTPRRGSRIQAPMPKTAAHDVYVFREGRDDLAGPRLLADLSTALAALAGPLDGEPRRRLLLDALLRAGELECALADAGARDAAWLARITDGLADALITGTPPPPPDLAAPIEVPAIVRASRPEGFAYYALHPLDFADLAGELPRAAGSALVIGLRSIGTTLSAVAAAALRGRGVRARRFTVRPEGHPYDRRVRLDPTGRVEVARARAEDAELAVVDEGPGLSGSSFLAVGEALVDAGASPDRVTFLGSRAVDPDTLVAPDAGRRFRRFRLRAVARATRIPEGAGAPWGGGAWRAHFEPDPERWPACWPAMERLKYLDRDGRRVIKFEGLGRYGAEVRARAERLAAESFSPAPRDEGDGFLSYARIEGRPLGEGDLSPAVVDRLADYCAFRAAAFPAAPSGGLDAMMRANFAVEIGGDLGGVPLAIERPAIVDGRMAPHEWIAAPGGALLKVDAATHGDDHFFPGPTDIAWDLAGAIVEWGMDGAARRALVDRYRRASGDPVERRLDGYLAAYALFRLAHTRMAAAATPDASEVRRLWTAHQRYRARLPPAIFQR